MKKTLGKLRVDFPRHFILKENIRHCLATIILKNAVEKRRDMQLRVGKQNQNSCSLKHKYSEMKAKHSTESCIF